MRNKVLFLILSMIISSSLSIFAQSPEEIEEKMNDIKMKTDVIFGEGFDTDKNMAYDNALSELVLSSNEIRDENGLKPLKATDLQPVVEELSYTQGQRHFIMVYLSKSQMLSLTPKNHSDIIEQEAPLYAAPGGNGGSSDSYQPEEYYSPSPAPQNTAVIQQPPLPDDILQSLCAQDNWTEIKWLLSNYKKQGKISETGRCTSASDVPADAFSILIDEMYGVLSILSPKNLPNRINYRTNQADSESNYSNCKVIVWYR